MNRGGGFSLLEVLIALALLSMIMLSTTAALRTLGNTSVTVGQLTDRVDEIRVVSEFLRNTVGAAMPVVRVGSAADAFADASGYGTYFQGGDSQMLWVAPLVAGADMGGSFIMRLALAEDRLELYWQPYQRDVLAGGWQDIEPRVLLQSVDELRISYLPAFGAEWLDDWEGSMSIPAAVRINLRASQRYWPELVIRLNGAEMNPQ